MPSEEEQDANRSSSGRTVRADVPASSKRKRYAYLRDVRGDSYSKRQSAVSIVVVSAVPSPRLPNS